MKPKATKLFTTGPMRVLRHTQLAVQVQDEDGEKYWFPFSQIREPSERELIGYTMSDATTELIIPEWMAKEKGLA